jgi:transposase
VIEGLTRSRTYEHGVVERAKIVAKAADGMSNIAIAAELDVDRQRVRRWRTRFALDVVDELERLVEEGADDDVLVAVVVHGFADAPRSGAPRRFNDEQEARLIAIACRRPADFELPHAQWSLTLLAREMIRQGIVDDISPGQIWRWLKKGGFSLTVSSIGFTPGSWTRQHSPSRSAK